MPIAEVLLPNGRPLRVRVEGAAFEQENLLETGTKTTTYVKPTAAPGTICILGVAIGVFVLLSLGIITMVVVLWVEVADLANVAQMAAVPSVNELSNFARVLMNSTQHALQNVERMTEVSSVLLEESAVTVRQTLNATAVAVATAQDMLVHPPELKLGIG